MCHQRIRTNWSSWMGSKIVARPKKRKVQRSFFTAWKWTKISKPNSSSVDDGIQVTKIKWCDDGIQVTEIRWGDSLTSRIILCIQNKPTIEMEVTLKLSKGSLKIPVLIFKLWWLLLFGSSLLWGFCCYWGPVGLYVGKSFTWICLKEGDTCWIVVEWMTVYWG